MHDAAIARSAGPSTRTPFWIVDHIFVGLLYALLHLIHGDVQQIGDDPYYRSAVRPVTGDSVVYVAGNGLIHVQIE